MKGKWRQILNRFDLPERLFLAVKKIQYYLKKIQYYFGLSFAAVGAVIGFWGFLVLVGKPGTWFQPDKLVALSRIIAGTFAIGAGGHLALSVSRSNEWNLEPDFTDNDIDDYSIDDDSPTIHTGGGNYNEFIARDYIQGDHITIQGDYININSDFFEVADQLLEIVNRLQDEGHSKKEAQQLVASDLANQAKNNPTVKVKLRHWRQAIGNISNKESLSEAATAVVQAATETSVSIPSTTVVQATPASDAICCDSLSIEPADYKQLENFLKAGRWKEADRATASLILNPLLEKTDKYSILSYIERYIKAFSGEDLRYINNLWLKYSQGRFGFSVQKEIWKKAHENYETFGHCVGWYEEEEDNWIYYSDITYSLKAPQGHLPILVFMTPNFYRYQTCEDTEDLFMIFVSKLYKMY